MPRLLDRLRLACRVRQFSPRTEDCYTSWAERFIRFHGLRHPGTMGAPEIEAFLTDQAANGHVAASTQNQAIPTPPSSWSQQVLGIELPRLNALRAKRPKRLPTVLSPEEVRRFLDAVPGGDGLFGLMTRLLYGTELRGSGTDGRRLLGLLQGIACNARNARNALQCLGVWLGATMQ